MSNQQTRVRLLETALDLIWQSNYNSVGVNEICKKAGVTKGSFYHHFESKAVLFCEASEYSWQQSKIEVDEIMSPQNPPLEQLKRYIRFIYNKKFDEQTGDVRGCSYSPSAVHVGCTDESVAEIQRSMVARAITYNQALVRALKSQDLIETAENEEQVARLFTQFLQGLVNYARIDNEHDRIKSDLTEGLFRILGLKREHWFQPFD